MNLENEIEKSFGMTRGTRTAQIKRVTKETKIEMFMNIDGEGKSEISTGIGFFDHMLTHVSKHGFMDLHLKALGDIEVDCHHTIEDVGIVMGKVFLEALGSKDGIKRYGSATVPMEEALVIVAIDICGRPYLGFDCSFTMQNLGDMDTEMFEEFLRAFCINSGINMQVKLLEGKNNHHMAEAIFKALGQALDMATTIDPRIKGALSTKGLLE